MKIVLNRCFGGFSLSTKAVEWLREHGVEWAQNPHMVLVGEYYSDGSGPKENTMGDSNHLPSSYDGNWKLEQMRADPKLVKCVETLGEESWGVCAQLEIVEIPEDDWTRYEIDEYDGLESARSRASWSV